MVAERADPRFDILIFDPNGLGPAPMGVATFGNPGGVAHISNAAVRSDLPHIIMLPAEISFYRAELALQGVINEDPQAAYEEGLRQIISFWGGDIPGARIAAPPALIDAYIGSRPALSSLSSDEALQTVHEELYLESFLRPILAWNTVRRTGVPELEEVPGTSISTILKRFNYPPDEVGSNINTPPNLPTDTPQWFEN